MRIDIIKEVQHNIIESAMKGKDECSVDITNMFVTSQEKNEVVMFLVNAMGMLAHPFNTEENHRMLHVGWSHIAWTFDED